MKAERELFVIQAQQVENCSVEIVNVGAVGYRIEPKLIGFANDGAEFHAVHARSP